jgi:hypothetical protein
MAKIRTVKVSRPIVEDPDHAGEWRAEVEDGEPGAEFFEPDAFVKAAMGGRLIGYFRAVHSIDGWLWRSFLANLPNHKRW